MVYFRSTTYICVQERLFLFNRNIHSTSTQTFFIRNKYSFNFNTNLFRSTEIFIPAQCKLYSTQQRTCILKLMFCKFPDIPNNICSIQKLFLQQTCPAPLPTLRLLGPRPFRCVSPCLKWCRKMQGKN